MRKGLTGIGLLSFLVLAVGIGLAVFRNPSGDIQPIAFSHKIHAGDNKIRCQYCHVNARRASVAGIPSVARCMGCHKITAANKPEIKKLKGYWDRKKSIAWTKVTRMPDFVFFEHWPHIRAGLKCQTCHGPVETMDQMERNEAITMTVCVECHRERRVSIDCLTCHR